jgi:hypothetical protein
MSETASGSNRRALLIATVVLVILMPLGYSVVSPLFAHDAPAGAVFLERPAPEHTSCVRDTTYMRFHHWELLRQIREEVVRYGIRGEVGLKTCAECHTSRERFCNQCHNAVSLYPDCYGCHYYP